MRRNRLLAGAFLAVLGIATAPLAAIQTESRWPLLHHEQATAQSPQTEDPRVSRWWLGVALVVGLVGGYLLSRLQSSSRYSQEVLPKAGMTHEQFLALHRGSQVMNGDRTDFLTHFVCGEGEERRVLLAEVMGGFEVTLRWDHERGCPVDVDDESRYPHLLVA